MTGWIAACRCDLAAPIADEQVETLNLCNTCGKRVNQGRVGSFTQFIFRFDLCSCAKPAWVPQSTNVVEDALAAETPDDDIDPDESLELTGDTFPVERYKPLKTIGAGSGGTVYLCRDLLLNKLVAVKTLHALSGEQLVAFQNEARLLSKLDHPNIVRILDFGATTGGAPYMVLEHSSSSSLRDAIRKNELLPPDSVRQIFTALADALSYCHERGVFHRDLKPENILFTKDADQPSTVKLIDFGIATADTQQKTHIDGKELVGTPAYMPPDQMRGLGYDARSEIYSLGCVMFEAITGHQVFTGETVFEILSKHANEIPPRASDFTSIPLPRAIEKILSTCLSKDPADRFANMQEVKKALLSDEQTSASTNQALAANGSTGVPRDKNSGTLIFALVIAVICIGSLTLLATNFKRTETKQTNGKISEEADSVRVKTKKKSYTFVGNGNFISIHGDDIPKEAFTELAVACKRNCTVSFENQAPKIDWSGLPELAKASISVLLVQNTSFGDKECEIVAQFPRLTKIDLSLTNVTDDGIKHLCDSRSLTQLVISSSKATGDCLQFLTDIPGLNVLEMDGLSKVDLNDLQALRRCRNLTLLNVGHIPIGDDGLRILSGIESVRDLSIDSCGITDGGIKSLAGKKLFRLSLADNSGITDKTIPYIMQIPTLHHFRYGQRNRITANGEKLLQSANPGLEIRRHAGLVVRPRIMDGLNDLEELQSFEPELFDSSVKTEP
jgi:serine/threonine protein kinase